MNTMKRIIALGMLFIFITSSIIIPGTYSVNSDIFRDQNDDFLPPEKVFTGFDDPDTTPESKRTRHQHEYGWFQSTDADFLEDTASGVSVSGVGAEASLNLSKVNAEGWSEMHPGTAPTGRYAHDMVYDSANNKVVLFGGITGDGQRSSETWLYDPSANTWTEMFPSPSPAARYYHAMVYDSANDKVVLYGGITGYAETWLYDVEDNEWVQEHPDPHPPSLYGHKMAYDSANNKVVLFGGYYYSGGWRFWNDTWLYDVAGNVWSEKAPSVSPSARYGHAMAYDPVNNKVVLYGGYNGTYLNDTWLYDVVKDQWTEIYRESLPPRKAWHSMAYDREINRILLYGGYPHDTDIWQFDTAAKTWTQRSYFLEPSVRYLSAMAHDNINRKTIVFGGYYYYKHDTWVYDHYRFRPSGTLTSPVIILPRGYAWDSMSVDKNEIPGTFINVSIINAVSSSAVQGFSGISRYNVDLSVLNDLGVSSIRLEASFKGTIDITPSLRSWGVRWKKPDIWYDNFIGDSNVFGSMATDDHTSALWHFDEGSGQRSTDLSGNGNNGTLGGGSNEEPSDPAWVESKFYNALRFDGEDDYIWVDKDVSIVPDNSITVEAWFKLDNFKKKTMAVLGTRANGDYAIQVMNDGTLKALLSTINLGPDEYNELLSRSLVQPGEWYHVALVFDRPDMILYLNGREEARLSVDFPMRHSNVPLFLGADVGSSNFPYRPTNYFYGMIDEIRISGVPRSPEGISLQARAGLYLENGRAEIAPNAPIPTADSVLLYSFEEQCGDVIEDSTRNGILALNRGGRVTRSGRFGKAMEFNGTDGFIKVSDSDRLHLIDATYQFWVKCHETADRSTLFSEEKEDSENINEQGMIDAAGYVHYIFDNGSHDIGSSITLPLNEWVHLAFVRSGDIAKIYMNGIERGSGVFSDLDRTDRKPMFFGGNSSGMNGFNGMIDEIMIYDEARSSQTIENNARNFLTDASFRTYDIHLRGWNETTPGKIWDTFHMDCDVPPGSNLNVTLRYSKTGEVIAKPTVNSSSVSVDLQKINVLMYPCVYIQIHLTSNGRDSPSISNLELNWSDVESPVLTKYIFENLLVPEDTPLSGIKDVSEHFFDVYRDIRNSTYTIGFVSEPENIELSLNGSILDVAYLRENWTGMVTVGVNCTNVYGRSTSSNNFEITVTDIDDCPVWTSTPAPIVLNEDENLTLTGFFSDHVLDAENNFLVYGAGCDNENITVEVGEPDTLAISGKKDYWGTGNITLTVYQRTAPALNSSMRIPVEIKPVNDPPFVVLHSPERHSIQTSLDMDFSWEVHDVDSDHGDISFDFHLSKTSTPLVYLSDLKNTSVHVENLDDGSTYFWKVIPRDGRSEGACANGTWSFNINTTVLYPEALLRDPLNGSILNVTDVNLSWDGINPTNEEIDYCVYLGSSPGNLTAMGTTRNTWFLAEDLGDNATYFWGIIPFAGVVEGKCRSGIWTFNINTSFVAIYDLTLEIDVDSINITQGENVSFHIYLTNLGNVPIIAIIEITGPLSAYFEIENEVLLPAGTRVELLATIDHMHTRVVTADTYRVSIQVLYKGGMKEDAITISVHSTTPNDDDSPGESGDSVFSGPYSERFWLWVLMGALVLVIMCFIIFVLRKKREEGERERQEELDILEAEIVLPPPPPPELPPMEILPALPQYTGARGYGPGGMPVPLAQRSYAPAPGGEAPKQLPPGEITQPSSEYMPPPSPGDRYSSVPAPSVILPDLEKEGTKPVLMRLLPAPGSGVWVPRIHAPMTGTPTTPVSIPPGDTSVAPPTPPAEAPAPGSNKYSLSRSSPPKPAQGDVSPTPVSPPSESSASPDPASSGEENVLNSLARFLEEMPSSLPEKNDTKQPPPQPPIP